MTKKLPEEAIFTKDPDEKADYRVNWGTFLGTDSDTIVTGTFSLDASNEDTGLVLGTEILSSTYMDIWTHTGTSNKDYEIMNQIETAAGRRWNRTILIKVIPK